MPEDAARTGRLAALASVFLGSVVVASGCAASSPAPTEVALASPAPATAMPLDGPAPDGTRPRHALVPPAPEPVAATRPSAVSPEAAANAERLFEEGRRLMQNGQTPMACDKFEESNALDPASGTLLNLARCRESMGDHAAACASLGEALPIMGTRDDRARFVHEMGAKIGCHLP